MRTLTLYFTPRSNVRLQRIKAHLGGLPLSQLIAHVLMAAEQELSERPNARPWEDDLPSTEVASRHTLYLHTRSEERLESLRHQFQSMDGPGRAIVASVVVARAIALAEPRVLKLTADDLELLRIRSDAAAIDVEASHLSSQSGEDVVEGLLKLMEQAAALFRRAQRVRQRTEGSWKTRRPDRAWSEASEVLTGLLNDVMHRLTEAICTVRRETDRPKAAASRRQRTSRVQ